jgi:hypothetical protein
MVKEQAVQLAVNLGGLLPTEGRLGTQWLAGDGMISLL